VAPDNAVVRFAVGPEKTFTPPEISAAILRNLKTRAERALKRPVHKAVITVPAYFNDAQRQATKDAGRMARLEVVRLVNEPTAAALAYGLNNLAAGHVAVYDLGGGTFDISILRVNDGVFEVLATCGDTHLGGDDFDRAVALMLAAELGVEPADKAAFASLVVACEQAKQQLTTAEHTDVCLGERAVRLDRATFEGIIAPILAQTGRAARQALADAHLDIQAIDAVVLVGGSTRTPAVQTYVAELFGKTPRCELNPDHVVALGAAVQGDILASGGADMLLLDVCPLSLGIETMGGGVAKIIHRNSAIPTQATEAFTTYADGQTAFLLHVVQGEREMAQDCRSLARFKLSGMPPMPAGLAKLQVCFLIDPDGILRVEARELQSGHEAAVEVKPTYGLADAEVEAMLKAAMDHAQSDFAARLLADARVEAQRIIAATRQAFDTDADLLKGDEAEAMIAAVADLEAAMRGEDGMLVHDLVAELNRVGRGFAERRMNRAINTALKGRTLTQATM